MRKDGVKQTYHVRGRIRRKVDFKVTTKVVKNPDPNWDEYIVKYYEDGVHMPDSDYFTPDKDDAEATAIAMVKHANKKASVRIKDFDIVSGTKRNRSGMDGLDRYITGNYGEDNYSPSFEEILDRKIGERKRYNKGFQLDASAFVDLAADSLTKISDDDESYKEEINEVMDVYAKEFNVSKEELMAKIIAKKDVLEKEMAEADRDMYAFMEKEAKKNKRSSL